MADVKFGYFGDSGEGSDVAVGEAVAGGSKIVATGTPEEVSNGKKWFTGQALKRLLR
mgnify:CR=1 FL=1